MARITIEQAGGKNVVAFLDMIAASEIGPALLAETDDGYNVLVGSTPADPILFYDYADHPDSYNKALNSDAAGRYQIMHRWWGWYKDQLKLPDFGPLSQDRYAIQQIRESHALPMLAAGAITDAIAACAHIWASLSGAGYGQHENSVDTLVTAYKAAGGTVA